MAKKVFTIVVTSEKHAAFLNSWDYKNIVSKLDLFDVSQIVKSYPEYYLVICELHDDQKPSLLVFPTGGYKFSLIWKMIQGAMLLDIFSEKKKNHEMADNIMAKTKLMENK